MSAFSSRIDLAYRLGFISKKLSRDLHIIRRIRNEFAHNVSGCTFNSSSVATRVAALRKSSIQLIESNEQAKKRKFESVEVFQDVVGWIIFHLVGLVSDIDCVNEAGEEWGYHYKKFTKKPGKETQTKVLIK